MAEKNENFIYIIFTATPYTTGRLIRLITKYRYNHVSISLDRGLENMFSFSRYYKNTPLYAGFVQESPRRYRLGERVSDIKIAEVPVSAEQRMRLTAELAQYRAHPRQYVYNLASALCVPLRRPVRIRNSYTCVEFVATLLAHAGIIPKRSFCSIPDLEELVGGRILYEGSMDELCEKASWGDDRFTELKSRRFYVAGTAKNMCRLAYRFSQGLIS